MYLIFLILFVLSIQNGKTSANTGWHCLTCTVIVSHIEQLAIINDQTLENSLVKFCEMIPPGLFRTSCENIILIYGPYILNGLYTKETPDVICNALNFCKKNEQNECRIFPNPKNYFSMEQEVLLFKIKLLTQGFDASKSFCDYSEFKDICEFLLRATRNHEPSEDNDKDGYSEYEALRGTSWRGKDCNDLNSKIHPGAIGGNDTTVDSNCNGIQGIDKSDGIPYEDKFCKSSQPRGIISLGDSVTAHFHLPEQWFDPTTISEEAFKHVAFIVENEADWPQLSGTTGHIQNDWPVISGNTSSLYLKLWERNKCNFRDYQNVGVNGKILMGYIPNLKTFNHCNQGADSVSMNNSIIAHFSRDQNNDNPSIVIYSLAGNDVCNGDPDTLDDFTKPDIFYKNVIDSMEYLDTKLPNGSHVLLTGLGNGTYLYELLADRVHPIGRLRNDITYSDFYTYLSCLKISPCNGWMTLNETIRTITERYAEMLSALLKNVTLTKKFKHFDMVYIDLPLEAMIVKWEATGGEPWQLIEPVDGFHTNQFAHALYAEVIWEFLEKNYPDWLGPVNPYNDEITKIFGNQGGY